MAHDDLQDGIRQTRLANESDEYLSKREELRLAEIESMRLRERVAQLRRDLPKGAIVMDYTFEEGPADLNAGDIPTRTVQLSELFNVPNRQVVICHLMYGKRQTEPCPMCTLWIDGLNGVAHHVAQTVDLAIVATADPPALRTHAPSTMHHRPCPALDETHLEGRRRPAGAARLPLGGRGSCFAALKRVKPMHLMEPIQ